MLSVSSGGRDIAKKTLAPQTKITIVIRNGMIVQVISSTQAAVDAARRRRPATRRRYFTA